MPSPFFPTPDDDDDDDGGGGGGQGGAPSDADIPNKPTGSDPAAIPEPRRGLSGRVANPRVPASAKGSAAAAERPQATAYGIEDSWQLWWETNKFDFIELRRLTDAPLTGQGLLAESEGQRAERLRQVRDVVDQAVLPALRALTRSSDASVRSASVVALGKLDDEQLVDIAQPLLRDGNLWVRQAAMLALGVSDRGRARYALLSIGADASFGRKLLDRTNLDASERGTALLSASLRGGDSDLLVGSLLDDASVGVQLLTASCEAAGLGQDLASIPQLASLALDETQQAGVRSAAVSALGRMQDPALVPVLLSVLDTGALEPGRAAVAALGLTAHASQPWVIERLVDILSQGKDAPTRHFAAISLGRLGGEQVRAALLPAYRDAGTEMRPWLALALGLCERQAPNGDVAPLLVASLQKESSPDAAAATILALGLCGGREVVEVLAAEAHSGHVQRAGQAAVALGLSRVPDALPILREVLRSSSAPEVRRRAALGLGILGNSAAVPDLLDLMARTADPQVAAWAAQGIAFMGDANAVGPLLHVIESQGPQGLATTYAATALGQLFDDERRPALSRLASGDNYLARSDAAVNLLLLGF